MTNSNVQIIRDFIESVWNKKEYENIPNFISSNYQANHLRRPETSFSGVEGVLKNSQYFHQKHPNYNIKIEDSFSFEDKVASRLLIFDTSGNSSKTIRELIIHRIENNLIAEAWSLGSDLD